MKVLVTGGAGYIGSTVVTLLAAAGHKVTVVDNLSHGDASRLPKTVHFIQADITELNRVISPTDNIEAVLHFAAFIEAGESVQQPEKYWLNNTIGTLKLLDSLRALGIKKLVFSSTAAVYGNPQSIPITEEAETKPTNPYGMTKLAIDMAISSECAAHGLSATSLRYFNVAGAYADLFEQHTPETHIIPLILTTLAGQRQGFTIFGDDYPTPDGTCVRDYIHVADLARAHLLALDKLVTGEHTIYNLGSGAGFSNREVITAAEAVTGKKLAYTIGERRPGDPAVLIASSQKAKEQLGWQPEKPGLEAMISDAWRACYHK